MDKPRTTPKDFFLWAGAMVALYTAIVAFIALIFEYIDFTFPVPLTYYNTDPYSSAATQMAILIVAAPLFLVLMRFIRRDIANDASRNEVWVRRWALYLTVFVAGFAMAVDLVTLIYTFLSGQDMTLRFLLKVAVVFLVAGAGFLHFYSDIRGYWTRAPEHARRVNYGVAILVVATILAGFLVIGTPGHARMVRQDQQRVSDLQTIQWQLIDFWQSKQALPVVLGELDDPIRDFTVPTDPTTGAPYTYQRTSNASFKLCAHFETDNLLDFNDLETMSVRAYGSIEGSWKHAIGETCFDRTIDPERYPPYTKGLQ